MKQPTHLLALLAIIVAACGGGGTSGSGLNLPADRSQIILEITDEGGFVPITFLVGQPARYALAADGTLYYGGPMIELYPGPMLPNLQQTQLDPETVELILNQIKDMGLDQITDESIQEAQLMVADASTTVATYHDAAGSHRFGVYALGFDEAVGDVRIAMLSELVTMLDQATATAQSTQYQTDRVEINVILAEGIGVDEFSNRRPWPLAVGFDELVEGAFGFKCAVFDGDEGARLLAEFAQANQVTTWTTADAEYTIVARQLVGDQPGCQPAPSQPTS